LLYSHSHIGSTHTQHTACHRATMLLLYSMLLLDHGHLRITRSLHICWDKRQLRIHVCCRICMQHESDHERPRPSHPQGADHSPLWTSTASPTHLPATAPRPHRSYHRTLPTPPHLLTSTSPFLRPSTTRRTSTPAMDDQSLNFLPLPPVLSLHTTSLLILHPSSTMLMLRLLLSGVDAPTAPVMM